MWSGSTSSDQTATPAAIEGAENGAERAERGPGRPLGGGVPPWGCVRQTALRVDNHHGSFNFRADNQVSAIFAMKGCSDLGVLTGGEGRATQANTQR